MTPKVVVVGTSLGGLGALTFLLRALPKEFAVPIVIVQHRAKAEDDAFERLLGAQTALEIVEVNDKDSLEAGCVYIAPADYHLLLDSTGLALSTAAPTSYARPSIDVLFESAADAHRAGVIGVILTGSNHDGAKGCQRIKARGGIVLVQDPTSAQSSAMPRAAIAAAKVDAVLPLGELCALLVKLCSGAPELRPAE
jgi:two-component system chemotaxis response regulator CheB